ncbi:hypothetical protein RI129_000800 [Pyrocoelia pectoralis]|uniref:Uncharacterized protein n=1 Tax=Pyrocoelia pectoralis TaxID=417401 RepID=A0AAN7VTC5_9COLE
MGMQLVLLTMFLICLQKVELFCINVLTNDEKPCAQPLNLDANSVLDFYQSNSQSPIFAEYLKCTWLTWNFVTKDGQILYNNVKESKMLPWVISHFCEDVGSLTRKAEREYKQAAIYCENNPPAIATPLSVRQCIVDNYKPAPLHEYFNFNP